MDIFVVGVHHAVILKKTMANFQKDHSNIGVVKGTLVEICAIKSSLLSSLHFLVEQRVKLYV